jgi:hypothetical protein
MSLMAPAGVDLGALTTLVDEMRKQREDQQATVTALLQTLRSSPQASPKRAPHIKLDGVTPYKGAAGDALDAWVAQVSLHHAVYVAQGDATEAQFVAKAATTLADAAVVWWQSLAASARPNTWDGMHAALSRRFQPVSSAERALNELMSLQQSKGQTASEYAATFQRLQTLVGAGQLSQTVLVARFTQGLTAARARERLLEEPPTTLQEAIDKASRLDGRSTSAAAASCAAVATDDMSARLAALDAKLDAMQRRDGEPKRERGQSSQSPPMKKYRSRRDRGANKTPRGMAWTKVPGLTSELAAKRMEKNLCYYCGSDKHTTRDCSDRESGRPPTLN